MNQLWRLCPQVSSSHISIHIFIYTFKYTHCQGRSMCNISPSSPLYNMTRVKDHDKKYDVEALFYRARDGDGQAWGELFEIFADDIYRYAYVKLTNVMDAQDVTAETFKKVWLNLKNMKYDNFRAYLYRVAHHLIIDNYRTNKKIIINKDLMASIVDEG